MSLSWIDVDDSCYVCCSGDDRCRGRGLMLMIVVVFVIVGLWR